MSTQRAIGQPPSRKRQRTEDYHRNGNNGHHHPPMPPPNTHHNPNHRNTNHGHPPHPPHHPQQRQQQKQPPPQPQQQQKAVPQQRFHRLLEISQIQLMQSEVQKWIFDQCALSKDVEIEAKLGKLLTFKEVNTITTNTSSTDTTEQKSDTIRVHDKIGLKSLAWVDLHKTGGYFESTVTEKEFRHLNSIFNKWYANCNSPAHARLPQLQTVSFPKLKYKRQRTIDKIYQSDGDRANSVRVTIDMEDPQRIKEVIEKKKKSSMNICYPKSKWDIRISASIENVVPKPQGRIVSSVRCKDRISYQYDYFSIDITSTYTYSEGLTAHFIQELIHKFRNKEDLPTELSYGTKRTFEVELEIVDKKYLQHVRKLAAERQIAGLQELSYFFTQAAIQLSELASNTHYTPAVCKTPASKR